MAPSIINVLLTSFPGLGLPSTLSLPVDASSSILTLRLELLDRLPQIDSRLILTTTANKELSSSDAPISSLLPGENDTFLPLRLSVPLCGGKGGFGSQLRAAGGRMSSKRKNNQGDVTSSNRNLDGRRLRTVNEAKALAEYLALKPEMEKKEKEARRKRWQQVVDLAETREHEIRNGSKGKVDGKWMEDKEEVGERAREAVRAAMQSGNYHDNLKDPPNSDLIDQPVETSEESEDGDMEGLTTSRQKLGSTPKSGHLPARVLFGFDEGDECSSDDQDNENDEGKLGDSFAQ